MLIRASLLFLVVLATFVVLRLSLARKSISIRQFMLIYVATLTGMVLVYLGVTGRLNWLFAFLGAALPIAVRYLPLLLRVIGLRGWWRRLRQYTSAARTTPGQQSRLNTRYLAMVLDHDSGDMDGEVLLGTFAGSRLSSLTQDALRALWEETRTDPDSRNVLQAYLDRVHPDWTFEDTEAQPGPDGNLTTAQAYEVLGLTPGASREEIRDAHRRLIQKVHPDRGGSTYLAARINDAKSVLLDEPSS